MSKNPFRRAWSSTFRLLAGLGAIGLFGTSAAANVFPPAERVALESRVLAIRRATQQMTPPPLDPHSSQAVAAQQWGKWGNWANNWNNWRNWGNWGNWFKTG